MIKSLKRNDIRYTPFVANKSWNSQNQRFEDLVSWQSGSESGSLFLTFFDYGDGTQMSEISSAFSSAIAYQQQDPDFLRFRIGKEITGSTFYPLGSIYYNSAENPVNIDDSYQSLVYNSAKNLYYKESENPTQIFGLESLDTSEVNRTLPKQIAVFNVPLNKFGEKIEPNSVKIVHDLPIGNTTVIDDGNNNLKVSGSTFSNIQNASHDCVSATIVHGKLTSTYDGTQKSASISTIPYNLSVSTTYNGNSSAPINSGKYTIFSEISDGYYCATKTDIFEVKPITATVTVGNVTSPYDGNIHPVTVTTTPSGLNYTVVYTKNGVVTNPINVGEYDAVVTINEQNYIGTGKGKSQITAPISNISFNSISNVIYGEIFEIIPSAKDNVNGFPIKYSIKSGITLAEIKSITRDKQVISLDRCKSATSLGTITVLAETIPTIQGVPSVQSEISFTVLPKQINLNRSVYAENRKYELGNTTVNINNGNLYPKINLGILADDVNDVSITGPSTGIISNDSIGTQKQVTLSSPYVLSGTKSSKYQLIQPSLTVQIFNDLTLVINQVTYDSNPYYITNFQTINALPNNFTVNWYLNGSDTIIATEKFISGTRTDGRGNFPTNVGTYKFTITDISNGIGATATQTFIVSIIPNMVKSVTVFNSYQFNNQFKTEIISFKDKTNIKSFEDEIILPNVGAIQFRDRNSSIKNTALFNDLVKFSFISGSTATEYSFPTIKPTVSGTYKLITRIDSQNLIYNETNPNWKLGDFIYIVVKDVNETSILSNVLESNTVSSTYNLKKYFDPYTLPTWATVAGPNATSIKKTITNYIKQNNKNYLGINLTGGGGGSFKFNNYISTDKNVETSYYDINNLLLPTEYSFAPKNSTQLLFNGNHANSNKVIQRGLFYVPTDNYTFKFKFTNVRLTTLILYVNSGEVFALEVDDVTVKTDKKQGPGYYTSVTPNVKTDEVTLTLNRGYHKFEFSFEKRSPYSSYNFLVDKLSNTLGIEWVSNSTPNIGGGSGASIGFILPSQYIIDKDLQNVKFIVGKSGRGNIPNPIKKTLVYSFKITNNTPLKEMQFTLNGNQATGVDYSIISLASVENGGTVKSETNRITVETDGWDNKLYYEVLKTPDGSDAECKIKFIFPITYNNTVKIYQTIDTTLDDGGDTYMVTGSFTTPQYSFLGMIAGGGETIKSDNSGVPIYNDNYGTASVLYTSYQGKLLKTNNTTFNTTELNYYNNFRGYYSYDLPISDTYFWSNYGTNIPIGYNDVINGMPGSYTTDTPVGGSSVDLSVENSLSRKYGRGGDNNNSDGIRGNYVITGSNLLYEIYLNGSSIYNVDQIT